LKFYFLPFCFSVFFKKFKNPAIFSCVAPKVAMSQKRDLAKSGDKTNKEVNFLKNPITCWQNHLNLLTKFNRTYQLNMAISKEENYESAQILQKCWKVQKKIFEIVARVFGNFPKSSLDHLAWDFEKKRKKRSKMASFRHKKNHSKFVWNYTIWCLREEGGKEREREFVCVFVFCKWRKCTRNWSSYNTRGHRRHRNPCSMLV
jgi:hypothetical protein